MIIDLLSYTVIIIIFFNFSSSHISVEKEVQTKMIADHLATLHAEAPAMVAQENTRDLGNMYKLLKTVHGGVSVMVKQLQEHIKQKGLQATNNLKGDNVPAQFVESLLKVHQKYMDMIKNLFSNDQQFVGALDKAFESVINHRVTSRNICKSPELLAKYVSLSYDLFTCIFFYKNNLTNFFFFSLTFLYFFFLIEGTHLSIVS